MAQRPAALDLLRSFSEAGIITARRDPSYPSGSGYTPGFGAGPGPVAACSTMRVVSDSTQPWMLRETFWGVTTANKNGRHMYRLQGRRQPKITWDRFIINPEGVGRLFAPLAAFADGPFPRLLEPTRTDDNTAPSDANAHPLVKPSNSGRQIGTRRTATQVVCKPIAGPIYKSLLGTKTSDERCQLVPERS